MFNRCLRKDGAHAPPPTRALLHSVGGEELDLLSLLWKNFEAGWKLVNLWNLSRKGAKAV